MKTTRSYFTLAAVVLLAGTACSADEADTESPEGVNPSQEQTQEAEVSPSNDDPEGEPAEEFSLSMDGGAGTTSITDTHIEIYHDIAAFMSERGVVAEDASLEEFGSTQIYGRAATEAEYWGSSLSLPNHLDGGDMSVVEITLQPERLGLDPDTRSTREDLANELLPVIAETPHIDRVREATVAVEGGDGIDQVVSSWTEDSGYSFDR